MLTQGSGFPSHRNRKLARRMDIPAANGRPKEEEHGGRGSRAPHLLALSILLAVRDYYYHEIWA